mgnify:CR=1 FL=1
MNKQTLVWLGAGVAVALVLFVVLYFVSDAGLSPGEAGGASAAAGAALAVAAKRRQEAEDKARAAQEALAEAARRAALLAATVQHDSEEAPTVVASLTDTQKVALGNDLFNPQGGKKQ